MAARRGAARTPPASECSGKGPSLPARDVVHFVAAPVEVVGTGFHQAVDVGIEELAVHMLEVGPPGTTCQRWPITQLVMNICSVFVEVQAPRVGSAVREGLDLPCGSDGSRQTPQSMTGALVGGSARLAEMKDRLDAVRAAQPAVGAPGQAAHGVMAGLDVEAVENDFQAGRRGCRRRFYRE